MVLDEILPQVDQVFVYLDYFDSIPSFLVNRANVQVHLTKNCGNLHTDSRFLALEELTTPTIIFPIDDDIKYPPDYVEGLVDVLALLGGRALVGCHGNIYYPPHLSYVRDRRHFHFSGGVRDHFNVHDVGAGTCAFLSSVINFDVRKWPANDMADLCLAIEAQKRSIPRICIKRAPGWLQPYTENQPDSLWARLQRDDSRHSKLMRYLLGLYGADLQFVPDWPPS